MTGFREHCRVRIYRPEWLVVWRAGEVLWIKLPPHMLKPCTPVPQTVTLLENWAIAAVIS